jgi:DtxR family Mn-dependent transcriptional regulator
MVDSALKLNITAVLENYLETIAALKKLNNYARISDIARALNIKNPSVNAAITALSDMGLVTHEKYAYVDLTEKGAKIAQDIQNKHDILFAFLTKVLNVPKERALTEACAIEHNVSSDTIEKLEKLTQDLTKPKRVKTK